jgi:hypothetical protein
VNGTGIISSLAAFGAFAAPDARLSSSSRSILDKPVLFHGGYDIHRMLADSLLPARWTARASS